MALEVHVAGPGFEVTRRLEAGAPALIIGRDSDCAICLPDPERNISRRHLSVWNEEGQLHFHVLSVVNGVQAAGADLPPGARGVLPPGHAIAVAAFRVTAAAVPVAPPPAPEFLDTWARLQADAEQLTRGTPAAQEEAHEVDPFSDWAFHGNFAESAPAAASAASPGELMPFFRGLGIDPGGPESLTHDELEAIGRMTRAALQGLLQAHQAAVELRQFLRADAEPSADTRELNPLRMDTALQPKLHYLFGGASAALGVPPERALAQLASELPLHEQAIGEAVHELLRSVLAEFEPEAMKKRLLSGGGRLFESGRAWDAFAREYGERMAAQPDWVRHLLERHFARSYARALLRAKRNTTGSAGS
jgi:predicted component of type VI protein secretion system